MKNCENCKNWIVVEDKDGNAEKGICEKECMISCGLKYGTYWHSVCGNFERKD